MCLDSHAHGMRISHPIFHTPHKVDLTLEERPTPDAYLRSSHPPGDTMPMWRVQTEGYTEGTDQLVGVVSGGDGFLDSPDTEWISGGVNTKAENAVAIGRHGNFFHWGFAVSPTYMTEEAKLVFVNAIHYISRFAGQTPIARKSRGMVPRDRLTKLLHDISEEGYARTVAYYDQLRESEEKRKAGIRARIDAGEAVLESERRMLDYPPVEPPGRFKYVPRYLEAGAELGEDEPAIREHVITNLPYMRIVAPFTFGVDEEAKSLGVANHDLALLDRAVALLADDAKRDVAMVLLTRYTDESFETAEPWATWLEENRADLFFTESGGYKWLVNRREASEAPAADAPPLNPTPRDPLDARLRIERVGAGRYAATVTIEILTGWHAYDALTPGSPYVPLTVELALPAGCSQSGTWQRPASHVHAADPSLRVFEGRVEFRCEFAGELSDGDSVGATLRYQVCDESMCLPPTDEELTARLRDAQTDRLRSDGHHRGGDPTKASRLDKKQRIRHGGHPIRRRG